MIMKYRSDSLKLLGIEAALRRLSVSHPKYEYLTNQQKQITAGIVGEELLNKLFSRVTFKFEYFIFHDLHLKSTATFQMDSLFLTPYYAIIIEMKNIAGHIKIRKDHPQLERTLLTGKVDYFRNPIGQIVEITDVFEDFLQMHGMRLPIYQVIIFKDSNRFVEFDENSIPIFGLQELPHFIRTRPRVDVKLKPSQMKKLIDALVNNHHDYLPFPITTHFSIDSKDIVSGVRCQFCQVFSVEKAFREWRCMYCTKVFKTAHLDALNDYAMLLSNKISNKEFRSFLQIANPKQASDILRRMNLPMTGCKKKREYLLDYRNVKKPT
ncbi:nuclease-related domain-containing protein [Paenisporosarcina antarctica]|uniref:NERD domain-containing protein n=1 Tax=Paenisporosarcina antarctica TaxID=417367 RepID=A0A4P7A1C9_9BACL|nr:nuclease-related domain-containing protein [Paenisporosarcina antarctica]QBP42830.1 NERD domain-containing protein [Paenisporosarcina antarctica]